MVCVCQKVHLHAISLMLADVIMFCVVISTMNIGFTDMMVSRKLLFILSVASHWALSMVISAVWKL